MHYLSRRYLVFDPTRPAMIESDNLRFNSQPSLHTFRFLELYFRVSLEDEYSYASCFKFVPRFEYQKESKTAYIYDEDNVFIVSTYETPGTKLATLPFLHASKKLPPS